MYRRGGESIRKIKRVMGRKGFVYNSQGEGEVRHGGRGLTTLVLRE